VATLREAQIECIKVGGQLVIEDSPGIAEGIQDILEDAGQNRYVGLNKLFHYDLSEQGFGGF